MNEAQRQTGIIKCSQCGEIYQIEGIDLGVRKAFFTCKCGHKISIGFFAFCAECGSFVGVDSEVHSYKELAQLATKRVLRRFDLLRPIGKISSPKDKSIPLAEGIGRCMLCNARLAMCPYCHTGIELEDNYDYNNPVFCTECGKVFRLI
ncbi:MAG: hypothetical protein IKX67_10235 [Bacteroidales bacterium]|nr:hypothetical protein [Bacteroidales bacterium]